MSQEILEKLAELRAGQEATETRLTGQLDGLEEKIGGIQGGLAGLEEKIEQDHKMTMDLLTGLSKSVEMLVDRKLGPRPVARR